MSTEKVIEHESYTIQQNNNALVEEQVIKVEVPLKVCGTGVFARRMDVRYRLQIEMLVDV